jgi:TonB family protein
MKKKGQFHLARVNRSGVHWAEWCAYLARLELGLVIALSLFTAVFVVSKRLNKKIEVPIYIASDNLSLLDLPPVTKPGGAPKVPTLPQVPVPSEDDALPEEETIELTELDMSIGFPTFEGNGPGDNGQWGGANMGPRPLREVIPDYPDDLKKKGIEGVVLLSVLVNQSGRVDSVWVVENSSGNRRLAHAAIEAARETVYMPIKNMKNKRSVWIQRPVTFEAK